MEDSRARTVCKRCSEVYQPIIDKLKAELEQAKDLIDKLCVKDTDERSWES